MFAIRSDKLNSTPGTYVTAGDDQSLQLLQTSTHVPGATRHELLHVAHPTTHTHMLKMSFKQKFKVIKRGKESGLSQPVGPGLRRKYPVTLTVL